MSRGDGNEVITGETGAEGTGPAGAVAASDDAANPITQRTTATTTAGSHQKRSLYRTAHPPLLGPLALGAWPRLPGT